MAPAATTKRMQSRDQFWEMEWLGEIIVRALVEASHLVDPCAARRKDKHRSHHTPRAPFLQNLETRLPRQSEIKDNHIDLRLQAQFESVLAVDGTLDQEASLRESTCDPGGQIIVVFNQQNVHRELQPDCKRRTVPAHAEMKLTRSCDFQPLFNLRVIGSLRRHRQ